MLKTPSGSNAPPSTIFFVDRDLGRGFAEVLRTAGLSVEAHDDHFSESTSDEVWLRSVGSRGWIGLTHDAKIRYTSRSLEVILAATARVIVIKGKAPARDLAEAFVMALGRVERFLAKHPSPFIAKFYRDSGKATPGRIQLWFEG